jgi:acetyl esterase/lipase
MASQQLQVIIDMLVDLEGIGASMTTKASIDPMVQREGLIEMAKLYLGDADPRTPLAAPLYADLAGLPPLFVQVGTAETLFDDATRLTKRANQSGVEVVLEPWEDMIHVCRSSPRCCLKLRKRSRALASMSSSTSVQVQLPYKRRPL